MQDVNFIAPAPLVPATVHTRVLHQDGTPVVNAHVDAIDAGNLGMFIRSIADASGYADMKLYAGRSYTLTATTSGYREPACAGPVTFTAKDRLLLDTLVLDKTVKECRMPSKSSTPTNP